MQGKENLNRRNFMKASLAAGVSTTGMLKNNINFNLRQTEDIKIKSYRTLGRTGFRVSDISFGAGSLTEPALLDRALNMGVNYIDTGEHYMRGNSESAIGTALKKHTRSKIFLTTKININFAARGTPQTKEVIKDRFEKSLERLQTDYVDCLMIHMTPTLDEIKHEGFHEAYKELKSDGKVRFFGLSNHGRENSAAGPTEDTMESVIMGAADDGRFDVALFVYNFLQKEQGEKILRKCKEKNMGTTLMKMNPINSYNLHIGQNESLKKLKARNRQLPEFFAKEFPKIHEEWENRIKEADSFKEKYGISSENEISDAAIKFCLSNPDVHAICPTPNNFDELNAFIALSGQELTDPEGSMLKDYETSFGRYYCRHACGLCHSACPNGVPVNTIMRYNHYFDAQRREKHALQHYANLRGTDAGKCSGCAGHCEK
ncbi:MAG: aldo/keto reductase, partial [bacterium]|nr:aldo/keto reductase [bacterium]